MGRRGSHNYIGRCTMGRRGSPDITKHCRASCRLCGVDGEAPTDWLSSAHGAQPPRRSDLADAGYRVPAGYAVGRGRPGEAGAWDCSFRSMPTANAEGSEGGIAEFSIQCTRLWGCLLIGTGPPTFAVGSAPRYTHIFFLKKGAQASGSWSTVVATMRSMR